MRSPFSPRALPPEFFTSDQRLDVPRARRGKRFLRGFVLVCGAVLATSAICGGSPPVFTVRLGPAREATVPARLRTFSLDPAGTGLILYDMEADQVIEAHNRAVGFIPASTSKVATMMAALDVLGPGYRYRTYLLRDGVIHEGVLRGDLYLKGTGDPQLTMADLAGMAEHIRAAGVRRVAGNFYFDDSELARVPQIDPNMDEDAPYNPGVSALSIESNTVMANWSKRAKGGIDVLMTPDVEANAAAIAPGPLPEDVNFAFQSEAERDVWLVSPSIKQPHGGQALPVKKPAMYAAQIFARLCAMQGVTVPRPAFRAAPSGADVIYVHAGRTLGELSEHILTYSDNVMTELVLLKTAGKITGGQVDLGTAGDTLRDFWQARLPGIDWRGFEMANGSGLSSATRVTPEQLLGVLLYAEDRRPGGNRFSQMLPIAGWKGSLAGRLPYADTALRVWAKTGTINYAVALAGFLYSGKNRKMAFVIFVNDFKKRSEYELNPARRSKLSQKNASQWISSEKYAMDQLLTDWIRRY